MAWCSVKAQGELHLLPFTCMDVSFQVTMNLKVLFQSDLRSKTILFNGNFFCSHKMEEMCQT
jgi:hypothetical protein